MADVARRGPWHPARREVLAGAAGLGLGGALIGAAGAVAREVLREAGSLRPGEFVWHPERSPDGPVAVIVSLPEQRVHVYRNGIRIGVSTCSTGREGHRTPTGVFTVLQKDRNHRSSTYNNAPMPNMNRLTWSGIALHAGQLPGYPASHGCVRLPLEFSRLFFTVTHIGTAVIIAGDHSDPARVVHPGLVLSPDAEARLATAAAGVRARPGQTQDGNAVPPLSILVSGASGGSSSSRTATSSPRARPRSPSRASRSAPTSTRSRPAPTAAPTGTASAIAATCAPRRSMRRRSTASRRAAPCRRRSSGGCMWGRC